MALRFDVLTLFPDIFSGYMTQSLLKLALDAGLVEIHLWNLRDWARGKHKSVDDRPFGGGPGMVIACDPVFDCVEAVRQQGSTPGQLLMMTPAGERLTTPLVRELAREERLLLLCGRYEGFDERIYEGLRPRRVSIGDYVCNGGEVPAMAVIEATARLLPGFLGDAASADEESHSSAGWLEYPQYTRPPEFRGMTVPPALLGGHHGEIARWRAAEARRRSAEAGKGNDDGHPSAAGESPRQAPPQGSP